MIFDAGSKHLTQRTILAGLASVRKQRATQHTKFAGILNASPILAGRHPDVDPVSWLQRTVGNRAVQRLVSDRPKAVEAGNETTSTRPAANPVYQTGHTLLLVIHRGGSL
jgi:hypothetical protein